MSARHRLVKRRIRELEEMLADAVQTIAAFERVIRDCTGLGDTSTMQNRLDWFWKPRRDAIVKDIAIEQATLAAMPKRLAQADGEAEG